MVLRFLSSICVFCVICGSLSAASPSLTAIQPRGAQRGNEIIVTFSGSPALPSIESPVMRCPASFTSATSSRETTRFGSPPPLTVSTRSFPLGCTS